MVISEKLRYKKKIKNLNSFFTYPILEIGAVKNMKRATAAQNRSGFQLREGYLQGTENTRFDQMPN